MSMMRLTKVLRDCAAGLLVFGAAATLVSAPARAADDESWDEKMMRGIMDGLGLKRDGEANINYQERAPLVIPPSRDLLPPEQSNVANNPAWPKDPDVERRKAQAALEKNRNVSDEREREQNPLRPDQMTPGIKANKQKRQQARTDDGYQAPASGFSSQLLPSELGYKGNLYDAMFGKKKEEQAKFTGEPPRGSLTDPPVGYQTPSPDQPYGLGKGVAPAKPYNDYTDRADPSKTR
jgi:hypothetical protein